MRKITSFWTQRDLAYVTKAVFILSRSAAMIVYGSLPVTEQNNQNT